MTPFGKGHRRHHHVGLAETWSHPRNSSGLSRLELVTGWVTGLDARAPDIQDVDPLGHPRDALAAALLPAVRASRCCVAFSGGRDSSVLLAEATRVARQEGLPDPIPVTMRWPHVAESQEREWQEQVVGHLGLDQWEIVEPTQDLDLIGSIAGSLLREHGVLWPPAAHALVELQRVASGGVLVMGDGGDQVFGGWRRTAVADVISRRRPPDRRDALRAANAFAPAHVRALAESLRHDIPAPWVRPAVRWAWRRDHGRTLASEPRTWASFLRWTRMERPTVLMLETWQRLGRSVGSELSTPFWDPRFLRSLGEWGGRFGRGDRTALMLALFGDVLPRPVLTRRTKARFSAVYFSDTTRRFAEAWDGNGPEPTLYDPERLRTSWLSPTPPTTSAPLLQASWLLAYDKREHDRESIVH